MSAEAFWLEDPSVLLRNPQFIPKQNDTIEARINAITRIVILVFIILLILKQKQAAIFIVLAVIIICLAYYQMKNRENEKSSKCSSCSQNTGEPDQERFMAQAGGKAGAKPKTNPRKPFPPTIPEDFVVQNPRQKEQTNVAPPVATPAAQSFTRDNYLEALKAKKMELDREREIERLEVELGMRSNTEQIPEAKSATKVKATRKYYFANDTEGDDRVLVQSTDDDEDPIQPSRRGLTKPKRHFNSQASQEGKEDPVDVMMRRQEKLNASNPEVLRQERRNFKNAVL